MTFPRQSCTSAYLLSMFVATSAASQALGQGAGGKNENQMFPPGLGAGNNGGAGAGANQAGGDASNGRGAAGAQKSQKKAGSNPAVELAEYLRSIDSFDLAATVEIGAVADLEQDLTRKRIRTKSFAVIAREQLREFERQAAEVQKDERLEARQNAFGRQVEELISLPAESVSAASGRPHNVLLDRILLAGSWGSLESMRSNAEFRLAAPRAVRLTAGAGDHRVRLTLTASEAANLPLSPPSWLQAAVFSPALERYADARRDALAAFVRKLPPQLGRARERLNELAEAVAAEQAGRRFASFTDPSYQRTIEWGRFQQEQDRQLKWLAVAEGPAEAFDGATVVDLIFYMRKNGFAFAPVDPGGETAYVALLQQLRRIAASLPDPPRSPKSYKPVEKAATKHLDVAPERGSGSGQGGSPPL